MMDVDPSREANRPGLSNILCAIAGGAGGLAPVTCQFFAIFLPNIFGGAGKVAQAMSLLPQTTGMIVFDMFLLGAVFVIAAIVAFFNVDRNYTSQVRQAFMIGTSVPGIMLSVANGASLAQPTKIAFNSIDDWYLVRFQPMRFRFYSKMWPPTAVALPKSGY